MASRKEQKEQARAARIAQEQSAAAKAQRTVGSRSSVACRDRDRRDRGCWSSSRAAAVSVTATPRRPPASPPRRTDERQIRQAGRCLAQGHPPERHHARQPQRQGHDDLLRGPRVPDLQGLHARERSLPPPSSSRIRSAPARSRSPTARSAPPPAAPTTARPRTRSSSTRSRSPLMQPASRASSGSTPNSSTDSNTRRTLDTRPTPS